MPKYDTVILKQLIHSQETLATQMKIPDLYTCIGVSYQRYLKL